MTTIETKIARAKELAGKATPGPLVAHGGYIFTTNERGPVATIQRGYDAEMPEADAQFFAEARTLLPDLASECERLRALVKSAPHASNCEAPYHGKPERRCTCWKRNLTQPTP